ncbi:MAG: DUF4062 domain-containing protein [Bacteroidetes bacterium]|nr:DUF4062 domain-containing protein [Bacteroidota bacterium]
MPKFTVFISSVQKEFAGERELLKPGQVPDKLRGSTDQVSDQVSDQAANFHWGSTGEVVAKYRGS